MHICVWRESPSSLSVLIMTLADLPSVNPKRATELAFKQQAGSERRKLGKHSVFTGLLKKQKKNRGTLGFLVLSLGDDDMC